jgi:hypothetical protein
MTQTSSGKNPDFIEAGISEYQKRILMRDIVRKLRKSPDCSRLYSIQVPSLRCTWYQKTAKKQKEALTKLKKLYPKIKMILKQPLDRTL